MTKKKGSALLMILIALVVLSLIGTAIISYSLSNYKLRNRVSDNYADRYIAEGGIDQAYGAIILLLNNTGDLTDLSEIAGLSSISDEPDGYYEDLKGGDLEITLVTEDTNLSENPMTIALRAEYHKQKVKGIYEVELTSQNNYVVKLLNKIFE